MMRDESSGNGYCCQAEKCDRVIAGADDEAVVEAVERHEEKTGHEMKPVDGYDGLRPGE